MMLRTNGRSLLIAAAVILGGSTAAMSPSAAGYLPAKIHGEPLVQLALQRVFIKHGCPYNLDKVCIRNRRGQLVNCRCVS